MHRIINLGMLHASRLAIWGLAIHEQEDLAELIGNAMADDLLALVFEVWRVEGTELGRCVHKNVWVSP